VANKEVATLSFKVVSLYAIIRAIDNLPDIPYFISRDDLRGMTSLNYIMAAAPSLLLGLCGLFLWCAAPLLALSIFKATAFESKSVVSLEDITRVAFSVVGLFMLATALPDLVNVALMYYTVATHSVQGGSPLLQTLTVLLVKVILGFWLLLGSRSLVNLIRSMHRD
jgi:hypothetical protein